MNQQQADAGVGQRRGKRRGINEAGQRPLLEELAFQMQHQAGDADEHGQSSRRKMPSQRQSASRSCGQRPDRRQQQRRRGEGENQRHIFCP